jgi:hemerythrin HHE cation binding domain-containing protein
MADITQLILDDHETFRREFAALDDANEPEQLCAIWDPLAALLDVHAAAEEVIFYPQLLRRGDDDAEDETGGTPPSVCARTRRTASSSSRPTMPIPAIWIPVTKTRRSTSTRCRRRSLPASRTARWVSAV